MAGLRREHARAELDDRPIGRIEGTAQGEEHAFSISPRYEDIDWGGLGFTREQFEQVISVNDALWRDELACTTSCSKSCNRACRERFPR